MMIFREWSIWYIDIFMKIWDTWTESIQVEQQKEGKGRKDKGWWKM